MKQRALKFDVIRIVAIIMVLFVHVTVIPVIRYQGTTFTVGNLFNNLSRAGVPMFLLLTGALLLNEERPFDAKRFYRTSFLSIVLLLLFWLVFYAAWRAFGLPLLRGKSVDPGHFGEYLLTLKGLYPHLWYLFMLVGAYLVIPVLRLFVKKENRPYILFLILLSLFAQFAVQTMGVFTRDASFTVGDFFTKFHLDSQFLFRKLHRFHNCKIGIPLAAAWPSVLTDCRKSSCCHLIGQSPGFFGQWCCF